MHGIIFVIFILAAAGIAALFALAAKKRREALSALAAKLGLSFDREKNRNIADQYGFLDALKQGSNKYAFNVIFGTYKDHNIKTFDYHYETHSTNSKGQRSTQHHYFSFFILTLPRSFPELKIGKEGFFSKIAQAIGFDDIDFESHEFSRTFCVRSRDKKLAYDVCNARMIEYLLQNKDLSIEIENKALAIGFNSRLKAEEIEYNIERLITVRTLLPDYLFTDI
ncbi:hypothetical protein ACFLS1_08865 [Verrucomicrobiota bacterium]